MTKNDAVTMTDAQELSDRLQLNGKPSRLMAQLAEIQTKLVAKKGQKNDFGGYQYRSCEDILAAVKPFLSEFGLSVVLSDDIVLVGDRVYLKATAAICDVDDRIEVTAFAREAETKKGMDVAQVTGSASSYARKYALSGLLAIDNEDCPDALPAESTQVETPLPDPDTMTEGEAQDLIMDYARIPDDKQKKFLDWAGINTTDDIQHMPQIAYERCKKKLAATIKALPKKK